MDLTTKARVKVLLSLTTTQHDALLDQLIAATSPLVERYLNRHSKEEARVEFYSVQNWQQVVSLRGFPVLASPAATFKNDTARIFDTDDISTDSYFLDLEQGMAQFDRVRLVGGAGAFRASYTGGLAPTTADLISRFPVIASAVDLQVAWLFKRREVLGTSSFSAEGGSIAFEPMKGLLPMVREQLGPYRRMSVGD